MIFVIFLFQPNFKPEVTWGFLYPLIRDLREAHRRVAPTTLINALLFTVVTCLVLKVWWRRTGRKFWWDTHNVFFWDQPFLFGWVCWVFSCSVGLNPFSVGFTLLINFFNRPQTIYPGYQRFFSRCSAEDTSAEKNYEEVEKHWFCFFGGYSQELPFINRKRLEKFLWRSRREPYHRKLVEKAASTPCTWWRGEGEKGFFFLWKALWWQ